VSQFLCWGRHYTAAGTAVANGNHEKRLSPSGSPCHLMASIRGSDPPWKVTEVIPEFADAFGFEQFNRMQCEALPGILDTDANVVASAPTASGKTALAELAICRTLQAGGTALFIAPMRALTNEKESEWDRFEQLGYSVYVVTGERDLNPRRAERADILVMTPEKADSATRKHESARYSFVTDVDSVLIDEVHLLDSDRRGGVLEVVVSRLRRLCGPRIVALSATMKNVDDVAEWLDAPPETTFDFGDDHRPVELETGVKTYSHGKTPLLTSIAASTALSTSQNPTSEMTVRHWCSSPPGKTPFTRLKRRETNWLNVMSLWVRVAITTSTRPQSRSPTTTSAGRCPTVSASITPVSRKMTVTRSKSGSAREKLSYCSRHRRWRGG
jgi:Superfamily II helicase